MKIRIMGTKAECEAARAFYASLEPNLKSLTVSRLYPNRGSNTVFRLYIDMEHYPDQEDVIYLQGKE